MQAFFHIPCSRIRICCCSSIVGLAVWIGRASIKGYGLGMVAGAIVVGAGCRSGLRPMA